MESDLTENNGKKCMTDVITKLKGNSKKRDENRQKKRCLKSFMIV